MGWQTIFSKGPENHQLRLRKSNRLCYNYSTLPLNIKSHPIPFTTEKQGQFPVYLYVWTVVLIFYIFLTHKMYFWVLLIIREGVRFVLGQAVFNIWHFIWSLRLPDYQMPEDRSRHKSLTLTGHDSKIKHKNSTNKDVKIILSLWVFLEEYQIWTLNLVCWFLSYILTSVIRW